MRRTWTIPAALGLLLLLAAAGSMMLGSVPLTPAQLAGAFFGTDAQGAVILLQLRLPRTAAALLAGAGLAVAGFLLQTVTDNDLCAPNIIGVNSGAGFAVMVLLCLVPTAWRWLPLAAFAGALGTALVVLSVAHWGGTYGRKSSLVLAGVALSSLLGAGVSFLSLRYPDALPSYQAFSVGGFSGAALEVLVLPAGMIGLCVAVSLVLAPKVSLLCLGDEAAAGLGVAVVPLRFGVVVLASGLCAAVVSFAGLLGFVGLLVPHMVRRLVTDGLRLRLVCALLLGGSLTILADLAGRLLAAPGELPAGIFLALLGAPFFVYLLVRRRGQV